ncbi:MAG: hypothetical protein ALECFALPRED_000160 [Alectoria fallacina]|uniref:Uncharacterized protein n=1 Tax=Alectoria fallacina TaxID=1903189 RepID=A0A8H3EGD8_9LECA|nr:MAG: hypothetical protein ALECFALPRED_000160 [Alectoria fallacina]
MSPSNSSVQKQWSIGQSILLVGAATIALISAGSEDDIQPQAIIAMEGLGAGLLVHKDRIGEGVDALKGGENRRLSKLMLTVGLNNGGAARVMRSSVSCVASFLLAVACKTCFTDQEAGSMLYEMMDLRGVLRAVPVSRGQIEQAVGAVSGYGYKIVPSGLFNQVASEIRTRLAHSNGIPGLFSRSAPRELAEILSQVFEAFQYMKLISVLIWLLPNDTEVILRRNRIFGAAGCRIKVTLNRRDDGGWHIQKWYLESRISELIVGGIDKVPTTQHRSLPLSHVPIGSASVSLAAAYQLTDDAIEATGQIAAALVDAAFEYGDFRVGNVAGHFKVPFRDICQANFVSGYHTIIKVFGFKLDADYVKAGQSAVVTAYKRWMDRAKDGDIPATGGTVQGKPVIDMTQLLLQIENQFFEDNGYLMIRENNVEHMGIVEPVMHVAAEALYFSIFERFSHERPFRPLTTGILRVNARTLWRLLCGCISGSENEIQEFRAEAIKSVLPCSTQVNVADLATVSNGLVAYSAPLDQFSTDKRLCSAISIVPGTLRWGDDQALFHKLQESDAADFPSSRSLYESSQILEVFRRGTYLGLEARSTPEVVDIETLVSPSGKTLTLTTYLTSSSLQDAPIPVNWWRSVDAIIFSEHVNGHYMTAFGEECLAKSWEERKIFDTITWLGVGGNATGSSITRCINMTSSDEAERFFEAGRMFVHRRLFVRQSAPLIQCVKVALDLGEQAEWAIVA